MLTWCPLVRFANVFFLISQAFVAKSKVDDATIGEAVLGYLWLRLDHSERARWRSACTKLHDVVLHDTVVLEGVSIRISPA